jgi:hypothetical protein
MHQDCQDYQKLAVSKGGYIDGTRQHSMTNKVLVKWKAVTLVNVLKQALESAWV